MEVIDQEGNQWKVGRRWARRRHHWLARRFGGWRKSGENSKGSPRFDPAGINLPSDIGAAIAMIVFAIVFGLAFWFLLLPILLIVVDLIVVLLVIAIGIVFRIAFGRPWVIDAENITTAGSRWTFDVIGWRASSRVIGAVTNALAAGQDVEAAAKQAGAQQVTLHEQ